MTAQAQKNGAASVNIHLLPISLDQLSNDFKGTQARIAQRKNLLLAELGPHAWDGGRWDNQMGQIGLHVTAAGLGVLQRSANAVSFSPDRLWTSYTKLSGLDGSHAEINRLLDAQGFVDAVVTLNVDGLAFDTLKDGSVRLQATPQVVEEGRTLARALLTSMTERQLPARAAALAAVSTLAAPQLILRLSREGVLKLAEADAVRSLKPVGFKDPRPLSVGADLLAEAQRAGTARAIITIRTPLLGGNVSKASFAAQTQAHKRALDDVLNSSLAPIGERNRSQDADISTLGAIAAHLTYAQVLAIKDSGDARLLAMEVNRPVATPHLSNSTQLMNMQAAWSNPNHRGAGQTIVVVDSGVQKNHAFFKDAAGNSRVYFEACFGTDGKAPITGIEYVSKCPQKSANGDSPTGLLGSAEPCGGSFLPNGSCSHGTHVAGIAAGRASPLLPPGLQGVAPDARIAAIQIFSYRKEGAFNEVGQPQLFAEDLALAMEQLANYMTQGTNNNPFVINLSLGSFDVFQTACPNASPLPPNSVVQALSTSIDLLKARGVPVIAATGNLAQTNAIGWPACVPGVIKVSSVVNDSAGITLHPGANLANTNAFPSETFWLAPGGQSSGPPVAGSGIFSSASSSSATTLTQLSFGTSMAAPHIAGLYAAIKAIAPNVSVADISNFINTSASVPVTASVACSATSPNSCPVVFKRPRWP